MCDCYQAGQELISLPCQGCAYCTKVHEQWQRFDTHVDYVVPLALRLTIQGGDTLRDTGDQDTDNWLQAYTPEELRQEQATGPVLGTLHKWMVEGRPNRAMVVLENPALKRSWLSWAQVTAECGILYYQWEEDRGTRM